MTPRRAPPAGRKRARTPPPDIYFETAAANKNWRRVSRYYRDGGRITFADCREAAPTFATANTDDDVNRMFMFLVVHVLRLQAKLRAARTWARVRRTEPRRKP